MIEVATLVSVMVVNAFTFNGAGGNPAGVVLDADQYNQEQKQEIARLAGYAETAFVSRSDIADRKLEFFTPNRQIAHCGHATVATFSYLAQTGELTKRHASKETIDGTRDIILQDGMAFMEQNPQFYAELDDAEVLQVMASLSLSLDDLKPGYRPMVSNTGNSFIVIPLKNNHALRAITTDLDAINRISEQFDLIGYYAFTTDPVDQGHDIAARMFAPRYAIPEEAATGMAAGSLTAYLYDHMDFKVPQIVIEQGYFMAQPSKSEIIVNLITTGEKLTRIMAGGRANIGEVKTVELRL
jgi:PhzF family phenazine biosynthesis protein